MLAHASIVFHIIASNSNYTVVQVAALKRVGEMLADLLFQIDFQLAEFNEFPLIVQLIIESS